MNTHHPPKEDLPLVLSEVDVLWCGLMGKFDSASQDVLDTLHVHETQGTQRALYALHRAGLRRNKALANMLHFLDSVDEAGSVGRRHVTLPAARP